MQTGQEARRSQKGLDITGEGELCVGQLATLRFALAFAFAFALAFAFPFDFPRPLLAAASMDRNGRQAIVQGLSVICGGMCIASSVFRC